MTDLLRLVVEAAPNGIVIVNAEGCVVLVNAQVECVFGYVRSELLGKSVELLIPERYRSGHVGHRSVFFAAPSTRVMGAGRELFGLRKNGTEFPIEIGLNPIDAPDGLLVLCSIVDITERKRLEERFRLVVEAAPNGVVMINADGHIVLINAQIERMFGYERTELVGSAIELLIPERFRGGHAGHRSAFFAWPSTRAMGAGRELFGRRKDGTEFPIEIGLNPIESSEGLLVLSSIVDISERRTLESLERKQAASQRQAAETLARSSLLATMSHEIRTPLTGIVGCIDLLEEKDSDPSTKEMFATIRRCSDTLLNIINDILDFSKLDAGAVRVERVPVQPRRVLADVAAIMAPQVRAKRIGFAIEVDDAVPVQVTGDPGRLRQILLNLASNAIKFTNTGGVTVSLTCAATAAAAVDTQVLREACDSDAVTPPAPKKMRLLPGVRDSGVGPKETRLLFEVRDTGVGIPPDIQTRLFRPFVQADDSTTRKYGGTGLGLVISKMLVDLMHGDISLESEVGVGTCFRVSVLVGEHRPPDAPADGGAGSAVGGDHVGALCVVPADDVGCDGGASALRTPLHVLPDQMLPECYVLLVDDNVIIQRVVMAMLKRLGCQADVVSNGAEALEAVQTTGYDVVLMDCEMPVMDGFSATAELRRRGFAVPIVAMTANAMVGDRERCLAAGMDDYMGKPVRLADLWSCLTRWYNRKD